MIVFPMLGLSKRFSDVGHVVPKYMLEVCGKSILAHIVENFVVLDRQQRFLFIHNQDAFIENFIRRETARVGLVPGSLELFSISETTAGQADTVLRGLNGVGAPDASPLWIFNIDTIRLAEPLPTEKQLAGIEGYLKVFEGQGEHWSFALPEDADELRSAGFARALEVAEKRRISSFCSNGLYFFRSVGLFRKYAQASITNLLPGEEAYVAPLYRHMISDGLSIGCGLIDIRKLHFAGTPAEYDALLAQGCPPGLSVDEKFAIEHLERKISEENMYGARQDGFLALMELLSQNIHCLEAERIKEMIRRYFSVLSGYERMSTYFKMLVDYHNRNDRVYSDLFKYLDQQLRVNLMSASREYGDSISRGNYVACICLLHGYQVPPPIRSHLVDFFSTLDRDSTPLVVLGRVVNLLHRKKDPLFEYLADHVSSPRTVIAAFLWFVIIISASKDKMPARLSKLRDCVRILQCRSPLDFIRMQIMMNYSTKSQLNVNIRRRCENDCSSSVAVLISGQIRDDSMIESFVKQLRGDTPIEVFISTWDERGVPQVHDGLFRGYEPTIRAALQDVCYRNHVNMKKFSAEFHLTDTTRVSESDLQARYPGASVRVDVESNLSFLFSSNQERLFYKIHDVYSMSSEKGSPAVYIRVRPDLDFDCSMADVRSAIEVCKENENVIFLPRRPLIDWQFPFVDDNFAIAGRRAMKVYAELFNAARYGAMDPLVVNDKGEIKAHSSLANWLIFNQVDILFIDFTFKRYADFQPISKEVYRRHLEALQREQGSNKILSELIAVCS